MNCIGAEEGHVCSEGPLPLRSKVQGSQPRLLDGSRGQRREETGACVLAHRMFIRTPQRLLDSAKRRDDSPAQFCFPSADRPGRHVDFLGGGPLSPALQAKLQHANELVDVPAATHVSRIDIPARTAYDSSRRLDTLKA